MCKGLASIVDAAAVESATCRLGRRDRRNGARICRSRGARQGWDGDLLGYQSFRSSLKLINHPGVHDARCDDHHFWSWCLATPHIAHKTPVLDVNHNSARTNGHAGCGRRRLALFGILVASRTLLRQSQYRHLGASPYCCLRYGGLSLCRTKAR